MKRFIGLMLAALISTAGCAQNGDVSSAQDSGVMGLDDVIEGPVDSDVPSDNSDSESEDESSIPQVPLDTVTLTAGEAAALLKPDESGHVAIENPKQLAALAALVNSGDNAYKQNIYTVQNDLNLNGTDFTPIGGITGGEGFSFEAVFDGGDFIIMGLTIRDNGFDEGTGLFGSVGPGGTVKNVHVTGGNIQGRYNVGGIAGSSSGVMENCSFRGSVTSAYENVGGIVGDIHYEDAPSTVERCFANAEVSGNAYAGAFAGNISFGAVLSDCYALGSVTAVKGANGEEAARIGGFIGANGNAEIKRCYANAEVYTKVSAALVGGFIGSSDGFLENCYYNFTATSNWKPVGNKNAEDSTLGVRACETLELCERETFEGWDFTSIWDISDNQNRGLPFLR
ncbi:MAG: hypothetical protein LBV27_02565 [Oscillospiraceae bacterium]|jgi:hypothetical protein|nr:hypothetical protein [Oscillospiraceae bacterium]